MLLIDDAPFFRNMLSAGAQGRGLCRHRASARRRRRWRCCRTGARFDVVVTDIEMPGMSGFELASAVRGDPRTADVPIIGLSSLVSAEAIERGRQVGLHDYVAKFDRQGLIAALKEQTADMDRAA